MDMEEWVGSSSNDVSQIAKRKRSKRRRLSTPNGGSSAMITCSSSSTTTASGGLVHGGGGGGDYGSFSSTTSCNYESTEDEEDMANCLMLLAHGDSAKQVKDGSRKIDKFNSTKFAPIATSTTACKTGFFLYECKTCNRAFPSFQALGGHRASHRKPKVTAEEHKSSSPPSVIPARTTPPLQSNDSRELEVRGEERSHVKSITTFPPVQVSSSSAIRGIDEKKAKIHECSICGSEFSSGQALGGHMRRHRAAPTSTTAQMVGLNISSGNNTSTITMDMDMDMDMKKSSNDNIAELDLNLPAPEEGNINRDSPSKFQFAPTQRSLVLSAPALVDCHY